MSRPQIAVCVCTFKRPQLLGRLLKVLVAQTTNSLFEHTITVIDNDASESAKEVVVQHQKTSPVRITYHVEPEQNISLARNKALANSNGDYVAFIDDDEVPETDWLLQMYQTCDRYSVDGVLGPVLPSYEHTPPRWVQKGGFCDRPVHETGFKIDSREGRTGNLLIRREAVDSLHPPFRPEFGSGGEDRDFFRRLTGLGKNFVWCNEAPAYEWVPSLRLKRGFMIRRALLRGKMSLNQHGTVRDILESCVAIFVYTLSLPIFFLIGHHLFMKYLVKAFDHIGRLLAFVGLDPVRQKYVTE